MTYSNRDSRLNKKLVVPEDRLEMIRQLEKEMVEERIRRRKERRKAQKGGCQTS